MNYRGRQNYNNDPRGYHNPHQSPPLDPRRHQESHLLAPRHQNSQNNQMSSSYQTKRIQGSQGTAQKNRRYEAPKNQKRSKKKYKRLITQVASKKNLQKLLGSHAENLFDFYSLVSENGSKEFLDLSAPLSNQILRKSLIQFLTGLLLILIKRIRKKKALNMDFHKELVSASSILHSLDDNICKQKIQEQQFEELEDYLQQYLLKSEFYEASALSYIKSIIDKQYAMAREESSMSSLETKVEALETLMRSVYSSAGAEQMLTFAYVQLLEELDIRMSICFSDMTDRRKKKQKLYDCYKLTKQKVDFVLVILRIPTGYNLSFGIRVTDGLVRENADGFSLSSEMAITVKNRKKFGMGTDFNSSPQVNEFGEEMNPRRQDYQNGHNQQQIDSDRGALDQYERYRREQERAEMEERRAMERMEAERLARIEEENRIRRDKERLEEEVRKEREKLEQQRRERERLEREELERLEQLRLQREREEAERQKMIEMEEEKLLKLQKERKLEELRVEKLRREEERERARRERDLQDRLRRDKERLEKQKRELVEIQRLKEQQALLQKELLQQKEAQKALMASRNKVRSYSGKSENQSQQGQKAPQKDHLNPNDLQKGGPGKVYGTDFENSFDLFNKGLSMTSSLESQSIHFGTFSNKKAAGGAGVGLEMNPNGLPMSASTGLVQFNKNGTDSVIIGGNGESIGQGRRNDGGFGGLRGSGNEELPRNVNFQKRSQVGGIDVFRGSQMDKSGPGAQIGSRSQSKIGSAKNIAGGLDHLSNFDLKNYGHELGKGPGIGDINNNGVIQASVGGNLEPGIGKWGQLGAKNKKNAENDLSTQDYVAKLQKKFGGVGSYKSAFTHLSGGPQDLRKSDSKSNNYSDLLRASNQFGANLQTFGVDRPAPATQKEPLNNIRDSKYTDPFGKDSMFNSAKNTKNSRIRATHGQEGSDPFSSRISPGMNSSQVYKSHQKQQEMPQLHKTENLPQKANLNLFDYSNSNIVQKSAEYSDGGQDILAKYRQKAAQRNPEFNFINHQDRFNLEKTTPREADGGAFEPISSATNKLERFRDLLKQEKSDLGQGQNGAKNEPFGMNTVGGVGSGAQNYGRSGFEGDNSEKQFSNTLDPRLHQNQNQAGGGINKSFKGLEGELVQISNTSGSRDSFFSYDSDKNDALAKNQPQIDSARQDNIQQGNPFTSNARNGAQANLSMLKKKFPDFASDPKNDPFGAQGGQFRAQIGRGEGPKDSSISGIQGANQFVNQVLKETDDAFNSILSRINATTKNNKGEEKEKDRSKSKKEKQKSVRAVKSTDKIRKKRNLIGSLGEIPIPAKTQQLSQKTIQSVTRLPTNHQSRINNNSSNPKKPTSASKSGHSKQEISNYKPVSTRKLKRNKRKGSGLRQKALTGNLVSVFNAFAVNQESPESGAKEGASGFEPLKMSKFSLSQADNNLEPYPFPSSTTPTKKGAQTNNLSSKLSSLRSSAMELRLFLKEQLGDFLGTIDKNTQTITKIRKSAVIASTTEDQKTPDQKPPAMTRQYSSAKQQIFSTSEHRQVGSDKMKIIRSNYSTGQTTTDLLTRKNSGATLKRKQSDRSASKKKRKRSRSRSRSKSKTLKERFDTTKQNYPTPPVPSTKVIKQVYTCTSQKTIFSQTADAQPSAGNQKTTRKLLSQNSYPQPVRNASQTKLKSSQVGVGSEQNIGNPLSFKPQNRAVVQLVKTAGIGGNGAGATPTNGTRRVTPIRRKVVRTNGGPSGRKVSANSPSPEAALTRFSPPRYLSPGKGLTGTAAAQPDSAKKTAGQQPVYRTAGQQIMQPKKAIVSTGKRRVQSRLSPNRDNPRLSPDRKGNSRFSPIRDNKRLSPNRTKAIVAAPTGTGTTLNGRLSPNRVVATTNNRSNRISPKRTTATTNRFSPNHPTNSRFSPSRNARISPSRTNNRLSPSRHDRFSTNQRVGVTGWSKAYGKVGSKRGFRGVSQRGALGEFGDSAVVSKSQVR